MVQQDKKDYDVILKILLLGDGSTGKSAFLLRYADGIFVENAMPTVGVDFKIKT